MPYYTAAVVLCILSMITMQSCVGSSNTLSAVENGISVSSSGPSFWQSAANGWVSPWTAPAGTPGCCTFL